MSGKQGKDLMLWPKPSKTVRKISGLLGASQPKNLHDVRSLTDSSSMSNQVRVTELQNYVVNKIEALKKTQATVKKLTQLAAFIPDFILKEETSRKVPYQRSTEAVVFMVDVSGFTALTEAYSLKGKGGTDQLTKTLMGYIGPLAETILMCEGDIVKYAGDAFLAFWSTTQSEYAEDVQRAIDCALYIQEKYGSYLCKEVDITIRVKVGIGAGTVHLCGIGNDSYQHYVAFGPGVQGASEGEKHCTSGEVVLDQSTWRHCNPAHYRATVRDDTFRVVTQIHTFIKPEKRGMHL
jgi:adenylate cyclase 10